MSSFFQPCSNGLYDQCKVCNVKIKKRADSASSNKSRHVKNKHPMEFSAQHSNDIPRKLSTANTPDFSPLQHEIIPCQSEKCSTSSNNPHSTEIWVKSEDLKLIHPFSLIISGPTSSGKSTCLRINYIDKLDRDKNILIYF